MTRPLSSFDYRAFTADPDRLDVPAGFLVRPLPALTEPVAQPPAPVPGPTTAGERLVPVEHRGIRVLSPYWHVGWRAARPGALLRSGAAEALYRVCGTLPDGFGLAVLDAWRPLALQREIYGAAYADGALPAGFVSAPSPDPATPPPHLTGGTVDVTLTWQGHPLALGTPFDDFTDDARADAYEDTPGRVRALRRLLYWTMRGQGFVVLDQEWWHFELGTRRWAALTGGPVRYGAAHPHGWLGARTAAGRESSRA